MTENFWWVFAAYSVAWLILFAYVAKLMSAQKDLKRSVESLKAERSTSGR